MRLLWIVSLALLLGASPAAAQVLGACGTKDALKPARPAPAGSATRIPLPGEPAPNFELPAVVGQEIRNVRLSEYDGKWRVVCFYPADFTFVWPTELSAVADKYAQLKKLGVEVIAVSTDTHFSHWMFKRTSPTVKKVQYAMAADPTRTVSRAYGVYNEQTGVNQRGRFIISPKGTIMAVEVLTGPVGRNTDELIRQIQAMQAVEKNKGMAAPAGWRPGDKLISTTAADIGRY